MEKIIVDSIPAKAISIQCSGTTEIGNKILAPMVIALCEDGWIRL